MINGLIYGNYSISVATTNDAIEATRLRPRVNITSQDGKPIANMGTSQAFVTESEAESCGVEMGKDWIDRNLRLAK